MVEGTIGHDARVKEIERNVGIVRYVVVDEATDIRKVAFMTRLWASRTRRSSAITLPPTISRRGCVFVVGEDAARPTLRPLLRPM